MTDSLIGFSKARSLGDAKRQVAIVLDDDPTGTQPMANVPVLTRWGQDDFEWALRTGSHAIYVLTNTRALGREASENLVKDVTRSALEAAAAANKSVTFFSRGDSALRGHFPLEIEAVSEELAAVGRPVNAVLFIPAYPDAGRITWAGEHLQVEGENCIPLSETEFSQDATFSYQSSNLVQYIREKTHDFGSQANVISLAVDDLTEEHFSRSLDEITQACSTQFTYIVADARTEADLQAVARFAVQLQRKNVELLVQTGPQFVRAYIGAEKQPPVGAHELSGNVPSNSRGGLIVVGSHVNTTTTQLRELLKTTDLVPTHVQIDTKKLIDSEAAGSEVHAAATRAIQALRTGNVVLSTSREVTRGSNAANSLQIAQQVSAGLVAIVRQVLESTSVNFVVTKGGITSSDIITEALEVRRAVVIGPVLDGIVSAWRPIDGVLQDAPVVVFAGNVGGESALVRVVEKLNRK